MDIIKVSMTPHPNDVRGKEHSGIAQVVLNWERHLPAHGIELVPPGHPSDISIGHSASNVSPDIHVSHGLLWTEEFSLGQYAYDVNADLVKAAKNALSVIVPSQWVADVYRRDLRLNVDVVGHGINPGEWISEEKNEGYVLYTKNRTKDGLDPSAINAIARAMPNVTFKTTFATRDSPPNVETLGGTVPFSEMKRHIMRAGCVLMTDRETWGIVAAEAMAAGVPVVSTNAGAVKEFLTHGESGYLYRHQTLADAVQGIQYCLANREVLGENARWVAAHQLDWEISAQAVAKVIHRTYNMKKNPQKDKVSVVITSHNYGDLVGKAIDSVLAQMGGDYVAEVIVVDDSSHEDDFTRHVTEGYDDSRVAYLRVDHGNVALARNAGIEQATSKYVMTLDGDDWVRPNFVSHCIQPLIKDRTVGFTYSGTEVVLEDGTILMPPQVAKKAGYQAHKDWPTENYDLQFINGRANQFPACIIFRREALRRVGGYRARYAPRGAGTEDANLTLRLLATGWYGKMVEPTLDNLWVHTHGFGHVSGLDDYKEVDWKAWQPYTRDYRFPFGSVATPKNKSHKVRSYEPKVSVIIPVGPGHEHLLTNALDSLEAQEYRKWEAVVVWDFDAGRRVTEYYMEAYPFVSWQVSFGQHGIPHGPGRARNTGVDHARADYITFLDADDYYSPQFLNFVNPGVMLKHGAMVYSKYLSRMSKEQHATFGGDIIKEEGDNVVVSYGFKPFDRKKAMTRPVGDRPYVWTGINIMLPKKWHYAVGGFNEEIGSWEDSLYLLELAWKGFDFHLVDKPLWVYSFIDGMRRAASKQHEAGMMSVLQERYDMAMAEQYTSIDTG